MTDRSGTPEPGTTHTRAGVVYAGLAAASAALLLSLPVLLLGITMSVVVSVMRGDVVGWRGSVDLTLVFIGIPALLSLLLLFIPYTLFRAASGRLGSRRAIRWVGGLLVAWHAGVALIWVRPAMSGFTTAAERPEIWYAVAFGIAAVVILIATVVAERRAVRAAVALFGGLAVALVALVAVLISVWGSPPRIPASAQVVHVVVTASEVRLDPPTVHAGNIYFVVEGPDDPAEHAGFTFVSAGYGRDDTPLPLGDDAVARLARGDTQGTAIDGGWDNYAKFTLREGKYAFLVGPGGDVGVPPQSMAVLEVLP
jgi:hypothetical protein